MQPSQQLAFLPSAVSHHQCVCVCLVFYMTLWMSVIPAYVCSPSRCLRGNVASGAWKPFPLQLINNMVPTLGGELYKLWSLKSTSVESCWWLSLPLMSYLMSPWLGWNVTAVDPDRICGLICVKHCILPVTWLYVVMQDSTWLEWLSYYWCATYLHAY